MRKLNTQRSNSLFGALFVKYQTCRGCIRAWIRHIKRVEDALGKSTLTQLVHRPNIPVILDDVVKDGHGPFILGLYAKHHTQRVENVRVTSLVLLALMGFDRDCDGIF